MLFIYYYYNNFKFIGLLAWSYLTDAGTHYYESLILYQVVLHLRWDKLFEHIHYLRFLMKLHIFNLISEINFVQMANFPIKISMDSIY
jgi:hypothetical protein